MSLKRPEWVYWFVLMFFVALAVNALFKLHSMGLPLLPFVIQATFVAAFFSVFVYIRERRES